MWSLWPLPCKYEFNPVPLPHVKLNFQINSICFCAGFNSLFYWLLFKMDILAPDYLYLYSKYSIICLQYKKSYMKTRYDDHNDYDCRSHFEM